MARSFILKRAHRPDDRKLHRAHGVNPERTRRKKTPIRKCVSESVCECARETGFRANLVLLLRVLSPRQPPVSGRVGREKRQREEEEEEKKNPL